MCHWTAFSSSLESFQVINGEQRGHNHSRASQNAGFLEWGINNMARRKIGCFMKGQVFFSMFCSRKDYLRRPTVLRGQPTFRHQYAQAYWTPLSHKTVLKESVGSN